MFERYDINNLYLAEVGVRYPTSEINAGGILMMDLIGYSYYTVLLKDGDQYIDLANQNRKVHTEENKTKVSYIIEYIEPMSKYYDQSGKKKLSKRKSLVLANKSFRQFNNDRKKKIQE